MRPHISMAARLALVLAGSTMLTCAAQAQGTNPSGTRYPYWDTAPQGYRGSWTIVPAPGMSPTTISNAARSPGVSSGSDFGLGGTYAPSFITSADIVLGRQSLGPKQADNKAHILMRVPADAEIWVEGVKTKQTGEERYFFSPPLTPGKKYIYQMHIHWTKDGKPMDLTERLLVQANESLRRDFTRPAPATRPR